MIRPLHVPRLTPKARTALAGYVRAFPAADPVLVVALDAAPEAGGLPDVHLQLVPASTPLAEGEAERDALPVPIRFAASVGDRMKALEIDFQEEDQEGGAPGFLVRTAGPSGSRAPGPSSPSSSPTSGLPPVEASADPALVQIQLRRSPSGSPPAAAHVAEEGELTAEALARLSVRIRSEIINRVNPLVESHGGAVRLVQLRPDAVAEVAMGGGCQGCSAAAGTLQEVVARILRKAVPELRGVEDVTVHAEGTNPFFSPT